MLSFDVDILGQSVHFETYSYGKTSSSGAIVIASGSIPGLF